MVSSLWCPRAGLGLVYRLPVFQAGPDGPWKNGPTPFFRCRLDIFSRPISALGPWHSLKRNIKKMMGEWVRLGVEQPVWRTSCYKVLDHWIGPYAMQIKKPIYVYFLAKIQYFVVNILNKNTVFCRQYFELFAV